MIEMSTEIRKADRIILPQRKRSAHSYQSLMRYAAALGFGEIYTKIDKKTGLKAIIAIHNLTRGPAIGGCRFLTYPTFNLALEDALRLAYMMSYKAAINNLPHGGAKAVLLKPDIILDQEAYFEAYGDFVNELDGRYITAVDSGTSPLEMDIIAKKTPFVTCTSHTLGLSDPSPLTALGVRRAIEAAVKFKLARPTLSGVRINIQGVGHVGYPLTKDLVEKGAIVTLTDMNKAKAMEVAAELNVQYCEPHEIFDLPGDVFAPCALGAVLNKNVINRLQVKIVAGAANNQLAHSQYGMLLKDRDILYAPDFLINAGGLIYVAGLYAHNNQKKALQHIEEIHDTVYALFEQATKENLATNIIAERIARERLEG